MSLEVLVVDNDTNPENNPWTSRVNEAGYHVSGIVRSEDPLSMYEGNHPSLAVLAPLNSITAMLEALHKLKIVHPGLPVVVISDDKGLFSSAMCGPFERVACLHPRDLRKGFADVLQSSAKTCNLGRDGVHPVIIGRSQAIQKIREKIRAVSDKPVTVLITGESGTGKELIARSLHCHSSRSDKPLVKVNCGALPDTLLESEVFGYQRGAFTGAHSDKPGRMETANHGTLFIDEIGALPLPMQVKFLQVLEEKVFSRLGDVRDQAIETRVIAATNVDILAEVREGRFRKDLYFRLAVIHIQVPPLRDRSEDIPLLVHYFLHKYSFELGRGVLDVPAEAVDRLSRYSWPGNVRELENLMRRAVVMQDWGFLNDCVAADPGIEGADPLTPQGSEEPFPAWSDKAIESHLAQEGASLKTLVKAYTDGLEREAIENALEQVRWNRRQAAELLGVSYKTLLNRINALGS